MGLFSFLKGSDGPSARNSDEALVERVRTSARRRLIGAVVLLGIGVVAFPLIFETQPRPIPVDIPIEIPRKEGQPPLALPAPRPAPAAVASRPAAVITESKSEAPREPAPPVAASAAAPVPTAKVETRSTPKPEPKPEPKVVEPKVESKPTAPAKPSADTGTRFVVQVGAFAEASAVRDVRSRVEKIGLATYTQAVETPTGPRTRVRVGPFPTRDEADKVAAKLKAAGLPGAVLTL
ncbi:MAG: SPOR domain-containing protein [Aquincola sp.]|nr:SPOR domain-containing protein [Aquincola sp.]